MYVETYDQKEQQKKIKKEKSLNDAAAWLGDFFVCLIPIKDNSRNNSVVQAIYML